MVKMFVSETHENQNKSWHSLYPDDLEQDEIVPLGAVRNDYSSYWWVPNTDGVGHSRWRSKKQLKEMHEYISSKEFEEDMTKLHIKLTLRWCRPK